MFKATEEHRKTVRAWVSHGIPLKDVAKQIGCSYETLTKYFDTEISTAKAESIDRLASRLYEIALGGNIKAIMFWLERMGGDAWVRKEQIKHNAHIRGDDFGGKFTIKLAGNENQPIFKEQAVEEMEYMS